jgi:DUF305 family protein family protein
MDAFYAAIEQLDDPALWGRPGLVGSGTDKFGELLVLERIIKVNGHYIRLSAMAALSFISMYVLMYAMVDRFTNVYPNLNQFYMAGLMAAPMVLIELALMGAMYPNKTLNIVIALLSGLAMVAFFLFIRQQTAIFDRSFLKSMIPHHGGAILMCEEASIQDAEINELCKEIISGQQSEIDQMKSILNRLESQKEE